MATSEELKTAIDRFVATTEPNAFALVNGADNETVLINGVEVPTFAKSIVDFIATNIAEINSKVPIADIVDTLVSVETAKPLSANQGRVLKNLIDNINTLLASDNVNLDELQEVVDYIVANRDTLDSLGIGNISGLQTALDSKETPAGAQAKVDARNTAQSLLSVVCLGDSLTFGYDDDAQVDQPYPNVLSTALGVSVTNKGINSYIPRHRVWDFLIQSAPTVLKGDLLQIPPTQYEDKINQPETNALRTFYSNGQQKWVHMGLPSEATSVLYQFSSSSTATADGDEILMPEWVGAGKNNPEYASGGRWIKQAGVFAQTTDDNLMSRDFVIWLGANGMEADDTVNAIKQLLRNRGPRLGNYWVLTLPNRLFPTSPDIADWTEWTSEVNEALRLNFSSRLIDVDGYFMGRGAVGKFGNYDPVDANDTTDITNGIVPRSVKQNPTTGTHFSSTGYRAIGMFVARRIASENHMPVGPPIPLKDIVRYYDARNVIYDHESLVRAVPASPEISVGRQLLPATGSKGPQSNAGKNGFPAMRFTESSTQQMQNIYSSSLSGANIMFATIRIRTLPASRADVFSAAVSGFRNILRVLDYSGTKRWSMFANNDADTGVVADTDWHTIVALFNGSASHIWVDGAKSAALNPGATVAQAGFILSATGLPVDADILDCGHTRIADADGFAAAYHAASKIKYDL